MRFTGWAAATSVPDNTPACTQLLSGRRGALPANLFWRKGRRSACMKSVRSPPIPPMSLSVIPPAPPLPPLDGPLPAAATQRWARAQALQSIAFDSSAELELRAAYADTHAPSLLLAIAKAAVQAGHYAAGIVTTRQVVTQLEARRFDEIPDDALAHRLSVALSRFDRARSAAQSSRSHAGRRPDPPGVGLCDAMPFPTPMPSA